MLAALLLVQASAGPSAPILARDCPPPVEGEVVVCARPGESPYRLRPLKDADRFERAGGLPRAAVPLFGGEAAVEAESVTLPAGQISKRAMVRFRRPF